MRRALLGATLTLALVTPVRAGEWTNTLSSFDEHDVFDGAVEAVYRYGWDFAKINREQVCIADSNLACVYNQILLVKELTYSRARQWIDLTARIGLYHDLDVYVTVPIWISDQTRYRYQPGVTSDNTTVAPKGSTTGFLFQVPFNGPSRSGLGDLKTGIRWQPFNQARDPEEANWRLSTEIVVPTGGVRQGNNSVVGEGVIEWTLSTAVSRRFFGLLEPYFEVHGHLRFPGSGSLFERLPASQGLVNPGHQLGINLGLDVIPWERPGLDRYISIDLGVGSDYRFEGRAYSELFEAFAASECGMPAFPGCETLTPKGGRSVVNGLTDISHYGSFHSWIGVNLQFIEYVQLKIGFDYQYDKSHYLTNADAGKDLNVNGVVDAANEFNPVYNERIDKVGGRFVVDGSNHFLLSILLAAQF